jgi:plasmid stabilization system protein ParE
VHGEFRRALLRQFPYAIYFRVRSAIEIFAVFHARRDPRDLRRNLR